MWRKSLGQEGKSLSGSIVGLYEVWYQKKLPNFVNYRMKDTKFPWYLNLGRVGRMGLDLTGQGDS